MDPRNARACLALAAAASLVIAGNARAGWGPGGVSIANEAGVQSNARIASAGSGASIVTWDDTRAGGVGVYAQKLDALGNAQWADNGVMVAPASGQHPRVLGDGSGGAFIVWRDGRSGFIGIYGQRLNASGVPQWNSGGVRLSNTFGDPEIESDGSGGLVVGWIASGDVYAQRVTSSGSAQWGFGVVVCRHPQQQEEVGISGDGSGGAILVWLDHRDNTHRAFARRVGSAGDTLWTPNGVALSPNAPAAFEPEIASDGSGGAFFAVADQRQAGEGTHLYVQRLTSAGAVQGGWPANGVDLGSTFDIEPDQDILRESTGGVIVSQNGGHVSHVMDTGTNNWSLDLVTLLQASDAPIKVRLASDTQGGAIAGWHDLRSLADYDTYGTQVLANGTLSGTCPVGGEALSGTVTGHQTTVSICSDGSGSAIAAWQDMRFDSGDIYALKLTCPAVVGVDDAPVAGGLRVRMETNPSFGARRVLLTLPDDRAVHVTLHDVSGRVIERHTVSKAGGGTYALDLDPEKRLAAGTYFVRVHHEGRAVTEKATFLR